jgi:hypothetical protein
MYLYSGTQIEATEFETSPDFAEFKPAEAKRLPPKQAVFS